MAVKRNLRNAFAIIYASITCVKSRWNHAGRSEIEGETAYAALQAT